MRKELYIFILLFISFGYLSNVYTSSFLTNDVTVVLVIIWGIVGWVMYPPKENNTVLTLFNSWVVGIIGLLFLITPLIPLFEYNQSYIDSLIAQRANYVFLLLFVFLRMNPTIDEVIMPIRVLSYITVLYYIVSIVYPQFFFTEEMVKEMLNSRLRHHSTDIGFFVPGFRLAVFYFLYLIGCFIKDSNNRIFIECCVFLFVIIAMQNRSSIIGTVPFFIYSIFKTNQKSKVFYVVSVILIIAAALPFLTAIYNSLLDETTAQINDSNYTRWSGLYYFGFEGKHNFIEMLLGNGVWTNSLYAVIMGSLSRSMQISDVGLIGTYYLYGIVPILLLGFFIFKALIGKTIPHFLKFYSLWFLIVPTIHCFLVTSVLNNILMVLYFYLVMYFTHDTSEDNESYLYVIQD